MTDGLPRLICDADSHIMELPDFLRQHADPDLRDALPRIGMDTGRRRETVGEAITRGHHSAETVAALMAHGGDLLAGPKDYHALGAFSGEERRLALDLLGLRRQVVFPSFAVVPVFYGMQGPALAYGAARALNRAIAAFCAGDARLAGVGLLPIDDPALARDEIEHIIRLGLRAVWLPHQGLQCLIAEFGGGWVPGMMRRLDGAAAQIFRGAGRAPARRPSEQILDQCLFTPYHHEDVGALIRASDSRLYAFSTDYPHIEGGRDPIASFGATLGGCTEAERAAFYAGNFLRVFGE